MLDKLTDWLFDLFAEAFESLWDFLHDVAISIVDLVLAAVVGIASLIPVPTFMAQGLGSLFAALDGSILYMLTALGIPTALGMIGAAYLFRLGRKVATLFQW
ncbi:MAG: hypothetical protein ACOY7P_19105 [Pseudomonadota bacterium]